MVRDVSSSLYFGVVVLTVSCCILLIQDVHAFLFDIFSLEKLQLFQLFSLLLTIALQ